jgi:hypothetical protein
MDLSTQTGGVGNAPEKEAEPAFEYTAQAASALIAGEVKLKIGENALSATALFEAAEITFAEVNALILADYVVTVKTDGGDYAFSRMGSWCGPFYDALCEAYNAAVLRALFVQGEPLLTAVGAAPVRVYEDCVVTLPPDLGARRVPLCFVTGMDRGDYALTLRLDTGESYTYSKLGYDSEPFAAAVEKQIRALREKSLAAVRELDAALTTAQASQIAKLMPEGAATPIGRLSEIAPSFAAALETKIAATRAAGSYGAFRELCGRERIYVGFKKNDLPAEPETELDTEALPPDPYLLWITAPSPDGQFAAVEFCESDSATFVYRTGGDFDAFARQLNRALEAIGFKREVIRLSDEELKKPENADYYTAAKRTDALQFVRRSFVGRVIHASAESWKKKLLELWGA